MSLTEIPPAIRPTTPKGSAPGAGPFAVLTPRRWTLAQGRWGAALATAAPPGAALELFAGAGHIGRAALEGNDRYLVQVDATAEACALAVAEARRAGLADRVEVHRLDVDEVIDALRLVGWRRFPLVIADPPYVASHRVIEHPEDPPHAIDGGPDGLALVRRCLPVIDGLLEASGHVVIQLGAMPQMRALAGELPAGLRVVSWQQHRHDRVLVHLSRPHP